MAATSPLEGLKVLDFMWVMAGPAAIRYLVDHGATVVHIESATRIDTARTLQPFKDGQNGPERSGVFANLNAGKLSLALNMANPAAHDVVRRLVRWADVLTESYSPKAMKGFGFDYEAVKQINPSIIMLSSCLNGQYGPESKLAGFGTMGAQLAGFGELAGWPDRPPAGPFGAYTDYIAPKFTVAALLGALEYRRRTGTGQYIDLSQSEASMAFLGPSVLNYTVNRTVDVRAGNTSPEHCPHGVFPCAGEDEWIAIAAATDGEFAALARTTGNISWLSDPRFATLAARFANREVLEDGLSAWTSGRTRDEVESALVTAGVPAHRVAGSADAIVDPQLLHRRHFRTVTYGEVGEVPVEASRFALSRTPAREPGSPPQLGEHNQQVLSDILGLTEEEIIDLVTAGALD